MISPKFDLFAKHSLVKKKKKNRSTLYYLHYRFLFLFSLSRYLVCAFLKLGFQLMICLKLENPGTGLDMPLYYIMLPLWIVLPVTIVDLSYTLYENRR